MRLAYLDPHPVPDFATESLQMLYTADALARNGVEVTMVTPTPPSAGVDARAILGREPAEKVALRHVSARHRWWHTRSNQPFYRAATALLAQLPVDAVFARNLKMAEHVLRHLPRVPLFFETHEPFAQTYREDHPRPTFTQRRKLRDLEERETFVYRHARGLVAVPPYLAEEIKNGYGIATPSVTVPNGVDLQQASVSVPAAANSDPILLYLGSLHPWKGVDILIRAMQYVSARARLCIVGGNAERIAELKQLAASLKVAAKVEFVGPVEPTRRFEWMHRATICLLPLTDTGIGSRYTSPIKLFEYLAAGKPIIVSDLPSTRAVVEPEQQALMTTVGDPRSLARAIDRLLADEPLRQRLAKAARERAQNFTWDRRAQRIREFIEQQLRTH